MKKFIVFKNGLFVDVEKIVAVAPDNKNGSYVYYEVVGCANDAANGAFFWVAETSREVQALIQKAMNSDVTFVPAK